MKNNDESLNKKIETLEEKEEKLEKSEILNAENKSDSKEKINLSPEI